VVTARLLGVIEAEQTSKEGTKRNDRLIATSVCSRDYSRYGSLDDVGDAVLRQIEHFFVSYNEMDGVKFSVLGRRGPAHARKLIEAGSAAFERNSAGA
jgi:inorganic pyrophosphatase